MWLQSGYTNRQSFSLCMVTRLNELSIFIIVIIMGNGSHAYSSKRGIINSNFVSSLSLQISVSMNNVSVISIVASSNPLILLG